MSIRATSLLVALTAALAASLAARRQENPQTLAEAFVDAARAGDRQALERLVHPQVSDYLRNHAPERWEQVVTGWTESGFGAQYEVVIRRAADVHLYDQAQQALIFGERLRFRFPIRPPSHFLIFQIERRTGGDGDAWTEATGSNVVEAIAEDGGRWYLTVPIVEILPD